MGVERQRQACLTKAAVQGWPQTADYSDNDVSASKDQIRSDYERLLGDITRGQIGAVVVWSLDRLHRKPAELERFLARGFHG